MSERRGLFADWVSALVRKAAWAGLLAMLGAVGYFSWAASVTDWVTQYGPMGIGLAVLAIAFLVVLLLAIVTGGLIGVDVYLRSRQIGEGARTSDLELAADTIQLSELAEIARRVLIDLRGEELVKMESRLAREWTSPRDILRSRYQQIGIDVSRIAEARNAAGSIYAHIPAELINLKKIAHALKSQGRPAALHLSQLLTAERLRQLEWKPSPADQQTELPTRQGTAEETAR
jgi:hypothetical protein